jgi:hypothetical protein
MADELVFLRSENARLQRQLSLAGIQQLPQADSPNPEELKKLYDMVCAEYPQLDCPLEMLDRAMLFVAFARRQPTLNSSYYAFVWCDGCSDWLRRQGYPSSITLAAFTAACVVSGVLYSPLQRWPHDIEFGLQIGGVSRPSNAWRSVLENGIPPPTPLNRRTIDLQRDMVRTIRDMDDEVPGPRHSDVRFR